MALRTKVRRSMTAAGQTSLLTREACYDKPLLALSGLMNGGPCIGSGLETSVLKRLKKCKACKRAEVIWEVLFYELIAKLIRSSLAISDDDSLGTLGYSTRQNEALES
jgi:hypothetical protein